MLPRQTISRLAYGAPRLLSMRRLLSTPAAGTVVPAAPRALPKVITITPAAADRIKELMSNQEGALGVRIGVKRRGCSGYSYNMNYVKPTDTALVAKDDLVEMHGVRVYVDPKATFFVVGTTMDYEDTDIASEFVFNNPNAKGKCGCGESFNM